MRKAVSEHLLILCDIHDVLRAFPIGQGIKSIPEARLSSSMTIQCA